MPALQHLNLSHNPLYFGYFSGYEFGIKVLKCSSLRTLKSIDLSNTKKGKTNIIYEDFNDCIQFENVYLKNNNYQIIGGSDRIFYESLRFLDLSHNNISDPYVSTKFF